MVQKLMDRLRSLTNGNSKRPKKETMLIVFLSGILIFIIMLPTDKNNISYLNKKNKSGTSSSYEGVSSIETPQESGGGSVLPAEEYKKQLEKELEEFLSSVSGVGEVKVLIHMKSSQKYIVEKDIPTSNSTNGESSEIKKEESTVYTKNPSGDEVPFISQTRNPEINGVAVAAKGAGNEAVRLKVVRLVMALYGVEANKVEVLQLQ